MFRRLIVLTLVASYTFFAASARAQSSTVPPHADAGAASAPAVPPVSNTGDAPDPAAAHDEDDPLPTQGASTDPTEPVAAPPPVLNAPLASGSDAEPEGLSVPGDPWGDVGSGGLLSLRALFQARYASTFAESSRNPRASYAVREDYLVQQGDGFELRRVFLRVASDPSKYVGFKLVLDFAELIENDPDDAVKQAFASLRAIPEHLEVVVGRFKIPFSIAELDASSRFEFTDFGETNRLLSDLGFAGADLGVQLLSAPFRKAKRLRLSVGVFRGHAYDEHDSPAGAVAARIETKPNKRLRFGASMVQHTRAVTYDRPFETSDKDELPNPPDPLYPAQKRWGKGHAFGADARYKKKGFMLRGEFVYGDRVDLDERYGAKTFWAAWAIAAYRIDVGSVRLLPALRYEWLDANRERAGGVHHQLAGALTVLFWDRVRFVFDVTRTDVEANTALLNQPKPLQLEPFLALDHVRVAGQLQLEF